MSLVTPAVATVDVWVIEAVPNLLIGAGGLTLSPAGWRQAVGTATGLGTWPGGGESES
jgi:hypothetical protein